MHPVWLLVLMARPTLEHSARERILITSFMLRFHDKKLAAISQLSRFRFQQKWNGWRLRMRLCAVIRCRQSYKETPSYHQSGPTNLRQKTKGIWTWAKKKKRLNWWLHLPTWKLDVGIWLTGELEFEKRRVPRNVITADNTVTTNRIALNEQNRCIPNANRRDPRQANVESMTETTIWEIAPS